MYEVLAQVVVSPLPEPVEPIKFKPDDVVEACLQEFKNANSYDIALFEKIVPFTG